MGARRRERDDRRRVEAGARLCDEPEHARDRSFSTPDTGVVAPLVDVGKGTPADYDKASVAGKIVLADGGIGRVFAEAVQKRGALGVLAYNMPAYTQPDVHRTSIQFGSVPYDTREEELGNADLARRASTVCGPRWRKVR